MTPADAVSVLRAALAAWPGSLERAWAMLFAEEDSIFSWPTAAVVLGFFVLVGFLSLLRERETRP